MTKMPKELNRPFKPGEAYAAIPVSNYWKPTANVPTTLPVFKNDKYRWAWAKYQPTRQQVLADGLWSEMMEFDGDALWSAVIKHVAVTEFPNETPGTLTQATGNLLSNRQQAIIATHLKLQTFMTDRQFIVKARADAFEALIGALMLDSGWQAVYDFLLPIVKPGIAYYLHKSNRGRTNRVPRFQKKIKSPLAQMARSIRREELAFRSHKRKLDEFKEDDFEVEESAGEDDDTEQSNRFYEDRDACSENDCIFLDYGEDEESIPRTQVEAPNELPPAFNRNRYSLRSRNYDNNVIDTHSGGGDEATEVVDLTRPSPEIIDLTRDSIEPDDHFMASPSIPHSLPPPPRRHFLYTQGKSFPPDLENTYDQAVALADSQGVGTRYHEQLIGHMWFVEFEMNGVTLVGSGKKKKDARSECFESLALQIRSAQMAMTAAAAPQVGVNQSMVSSTTY